MHNESMSEVSATDRRCGPSEKLRKVPGLYLVFSKGNEHQGTGREEASEVGRVKNIGKLL